MQPMMPHHVNSKVVASAEQNSLLVQRRQNSPLVSVYHLRKNRLTFCLKRECSVRAVFPHSWHWPALIVRQISRSCVAPPLGARLRSCPPLMKVFATRLDFKM